LAAPDPGPEDGGGQFTAFEPVFEWGPESSRHLSALAEAAGDAIHQSTMVRGVDALGWYSSFHVRGTQWGTYVSLAGIAYFAKRVLADLFADDETKFRLAFHSILQHELFHFATDYAIAQFELLQNQSCWKESKNYWRQRPPEYLEVEEKLANAWMLREFRTALPGFRVKGKQAALRAFVKKQPSGYNEALEIKTEGDWERGFRELTLSYLHDGIWWGDDAAVDWATLYPTEPNIDWRRCAIHLVDDSQRYGIPSGWLTHFESISIDSESERFKKMLKKMDPSVRDAWFNVKARLAEQIRSCMDLKRWNGVRNAWSIRINDNIRAHLHYDGNKWTAIEIGSHKAMGHG
jgi:hypothetical protein